MEMPRLVNVEFLKPFSASSSKIVQKRPKMEKNSQFFQFLGHPEETFDHKLGYLFDKRGSGIVL